MNPNVFEVFLVFLKLGLTSFGGPVAHLGFFHHEFVIRRKWIDEKSYADIVGLCQFLPGPASSQVGMAIGLHRAGKLGAMAAWAAFTLPSAFLLVLFALGVTKFHNVLQTDWLHSLKIVAVAVVAQALWVMGQKLCPDKERIVIALLACLITLLFANPWIQVLVIILGALTGVFFLKKDSLQPALFVQTKISKESAIFYLFTFVLLLVLLPLMAEYSQNHALKMFDHFFRVGSLVFGGGHVVLPLLQSEVISAGWVSKDLFMAGYGAAQAIPGPLFTFSAYLGAVSKFNPSGWLGALICLMAMFLPSFLLIFGVLPFWQKLRDFKRMQQAMLGINAAVVGLLLAAFYNPVWISGILSIQDFFLALIAFILLTYFNVSTWVVILVYLLTSSTYTFF